MKKAKENCDCEVCIECLSKCPKCGSINTSVLLRPEFMYHTEYVRNTGQLSIEICDYSAIIVCAECALEFHEGIYGETGNRIRNGYDFWVLKDVIGDMLGLQGSYRFERKDLDYGELTCYGCGCETVGCERIESKENTDNFGTPI